MNLSPTGRGVLGLILSQDTKEDNRVYWDDKIDESSKEYMNYLLTLWSSKNGPTSKRMATLDEIEKLVEVTKKEGAKVLCGGKRPSGFNKGYFYEPTVFDNVGDDFKIMTEEPFGPLTPILTFKNFDEVIKRANNQLAGLAGYVCTGSIELANKTSESLETGMVAINTPFISNAETPFGGIKQSGYGREGGSVGIKDYLNIKYTHLGILN